MKKVKTFLIIVGTIIFMSGFYFSLTTPPEPKHLCPETYKFATEKCINLGYAREKCEEEIPKTCDEAIDYFMSDSHIFMGPPAEMIMFGPITRIPNTGE